MASAGDDWDTAKKIVAQMGNFNNSLTQVTRTLERNTASLSATSKETEEVDPTCFFMMRSLLASPRIRANLYFAVLTLYPEDHAAATSFTASQLIHKLTRAEHSAICAGIFSYHLAKRITPPEFQADIDKDIQEYGEVGMLIGKQLPRLGVAAGLILGMSRQIAYAGFASTKTPIYAQYKSALKKSKVAYDLELEQKLFGCQHPQVASLIIQKLGFSRKFSQDCYLALCSNLRAVSDDVACLRAGLLLIEGIMSGEDIPGESEVPYEIFGTTRDKAYPSLKAALRVRTSGSLHAWLSRRESDISAANNPDIFEPQEDANFYDRDFDFKAIPEAIRQEFSLEDFASFRSTIQKILESD